MEIKVTVELGQKTVDLLQNLLNNAPAAKSGSVTETKATAQEAGTADLFTQEAATEEKPEAPKRTRRSKAEIEADKAAEEKVTVKDEPAGFADMDEDAQLEAIKAEVTRNTKKGKSADIKALLAFFDAGRASELAADQYPDFYDMVKRYSAGETVDALTASDLD